MQDERLVAGEAVVALGIFGRPIGRRFRLGKVGYVIASPFVLLLIPPDKFLTLAPGAAVRAGGGAIIEDAPVAGPSEAPAMAVAALGLALSCFIFAGLRKDA